MTDWTTDLVLFLPMDDGAGDVVKDYSGRGNHGARNGASWVAGKWEKALSYNGSTDYVSIADADSLDFGTGDFTICFWINPHDLVTWQVVILKRNDAGPPDAGYQIYIETSEIKAIVADGVDQSAPHASIAGLDNIWTHIALAGDRDGNAQFYINGVATATATAMAAIGDMNNTRTLYVGANTAYLHGLLDDIRIYTRLLSTVEIQKTMEGPGGGSISALRGYPYGNNPYKKQL